MNPNRFKATYLGDEVWFILNESYGDGIPIDAVVYTGVKEIPGVLISKKYVTVARGGR